MAGFIVSREPLTIPRTGNSEKDGDRGQLRREQLRVMGTQVAEGSIVILEAGYGVKSRHGL